MAEPSWWVDSAPTSDATWDPNANADDWIELGAMEAPGSGGAYSSDDASETIVGHLPTAKRYDARKKILGGAYADDASPWSLHRIQPMQHPDEPQLRAVTVDMVGYNCRGREVTVPPPPPPPPGPPPPPSPPVTPTYTAGVAASVSGTFPTRMNYTRQKATVRFKPHPYAFLSDSQMIAGSYPEYYRNCSIFDTCDPIIEALTADTAEPWLKWTDLSADGQPPQGTSEGGLAKGQCFELVSKANLVIAWYDVPFDFIAYPYLPVKLMAAVGKVNDEDDWLSILGGDGFPRGTLKLEAPKFKKRVQGHIRTNPVYTLPYVLDILLPMTFIDPPMGALAGGADPTFRGHNAFLWNRKGKAFSVNRSEVPSRGLFEFTSFDNLFTHVRS